VGLQKFCRKAKQIASFKVDVVKKTIYGTKIMERQMELSNQMKSGNAIFKVIGDSLYIEYTGAPFRVERLKLESIQTVFIEDTNSRYRFVISMHNSKVKFYIDRIDPKTREDVMSFIIRWCKLYDEETFKTKANTTIFLGKISESLEKLANNISFSVGSPEYEKANKHFDQNAKK
jgi:hypothetical protein